jgi:vitamin B12 transporter
VLRSLDARESRATSLGIDWRSAARTGPELTLSGSVFDQAEQQSSPGVAPGVLDGLPANDLDNAFTRTVLNAYARFDEWDRGEAVIGLTYRLEQGDSVGQIQVAPDTWLPTSYRIERAIAAAYGELDYRILGPLTLRASWRIDDADEWDRETTGQLGLSYAPGGVVSRMFVTWGEGFKLPSLFALAHPLVGNPELLPERAGSLEIGVELALMAGVQAEIRWFKQRFRDIIDFDFETFSSVNRARVDSDGLELSVGAPLGAHLQLQAHATLLDVTVLDGGPPLTHRPERLGGIDALWSLGPRTELFFGWRYVGERYDASIPTGMRELPAYGRSDLGIEWRTSASMRVRVSIDNVTDERYATSVGFPAAGRGIRVSWRQQFGAH